LSNTIAHFALDFSRKESVCGGTDSEPVASLLSPASACGPPRGFDVHCIELMRDGEIEASICRRQP
jgi:hypothetical protein